MAVDNDDVRIAREAGNAVKVAFDFSFKIFQAADIVAYKESAAGVYTLGVLNGVGATGYTLEFDQDAETGVLTWVTAPATGAFSVIIGSALPVTQGAAIPREGVVPAATIRNIVDKLTVQVQQLSERLDRAAVQPLTPVNPDGIIVEAPEDGSLLQYEDNGDGTFSIVPADDTAASYSSGAIADRPAAPTVVPAWYHATDEDQVYLYFSAAAGWKLIV